MENQEIYKAWFNEATIGILIMNTAGEILNSNPFLENLFGYQSKELTGRKMEMLLPDSLHLIPTQDDQEKNRQSTTPAINVELETFGRHKDGRKIPIEVNLKRVSINGGYQLIANINDVSKRKNLIEELLLKNTVIAQGAMPVAFSDLEGSLTNVNNAFVKMWGYDSSEELIGVHNSELSSTLQEISVINKAIQEEGQWSGEAVAKRKDGTSFNIFVSSYLVKDGENRPFSMSATFFDISELKKAQAQSNDLSKIVEDSLNEIFIFDAETLKFIQVNKGARQNLGYSSEEVRELTPLDIKPYHTEASFLELIKPLSQGEENIIFETVHERKSKTTYPVEVHLQKSKLDGKSVFVAIIIDITERKRAEKIINEKQRLIKNYSNELEQKVIARTQELAESNAKLEEAQKMAKLGYIEYNLAKNTVAGSAQLYEILDLDIKIPMQLEQFIGYAHTDDRADLESTIREFHEKNQPISIEFKLVSNKGFLKHVFIKTSKIEKSREGKVVQRRGIIQDITPRKKMEKALAQALEKEKQVSQLKSRFVSMASHEFRTPLTSIMSSASLIQMLNEKGRLEGQKKYIKRIESSVDNLTSILNDFLSLEKLESGKVDLKIIPINLLEFMGEIKDDISAMLKKGQTLTNTHEGSTNCRFDPNLLRNIMFNLLSNAIKYSPENSQVKIRTKLIGSAFILEIEDQGIGIPEEDQELMFTRFFRANNVEEIKGTGLGLTIVKRYVDLMEGDISFASEENKGTTFTVSIPQSN